MASHGWNRSGTQLLKADRADMPNVNSTSATAVPSRPHSTVTLATPTAVASPRTTRRINSTHGGSAVRNRDPDGGTATALTSIWTTLAWISTPAIASVWFEPKLVVTSCSSLTPARPYAPTSTIWPWTWPGSKLPPTTSATLDSWLASAQRNSFNGI